MTLLRSLLGAARSFLRTQRDLAIENLALRHQIGVLKRTMGKRRLRLGPVDRGFWAGLSRIWVGWERPLAIVKPATVIRWRRQGFKRYWTRRSRSGLGGRPMLTREVRDLIRKMSHSNPTWGAPRTRCHLSLQADAPEPKAVQGPELGGVIKLPEVGGLHLCVREAA
jgi:putative transposase